MCDDMFRISHGVSGCQMLGYIADTCNSVPGTGVDDITGFAVSSFFFGFVGGVPGKLKGQIEV